MRATLRGALALLMVLAIGDLVLWEASWSSASCPIDYGAEQGQTGGKNCPLFHVVVARLVGDAFAYVGHIVDTHHAAVIAIGIIVLAAFTFAVWRSTTRLLKAGERQLRLAQDSAAEQSANMRSAHDLSRLSVDAAATSADVALKAANAAIRAERPHLVFDKATISGLRDADGSIGTTARTLTINYHYKNFGRTPCWVEQTVTNLNFSSALPEVPPYGKASEPNAHHTVAPLGTFEIQAGKLDVSADVMNAIANRRVRVFLFGRAHYADAFGVPHTTAFACEWLLGDPPSEDKHVPAGSRAYWSYT